MKKIFNNILALSAASLALVAPVQVSAQGGQIEIFNQKIEMQATLQEIVADFNEEFGADAKLVTVPDAGTVLRTRMANNDAPDVINGFFRKKTFFLSITLADFIM